MKRSKSEEENIIADRLKKLSCIDNWIFFIRADEERVIISKIEI